MKQLSKNVLLNLLIKLLFLSLTAKLIGTVLVWFLPVESVELKKDPISVMPYHRISFHNMLEKGQSHVSQKHSVLKALSINNLLLVGLYGNEQYGFIVVSTKRAPSKTDIISIGESYKGYKLKKIFLNYVIFTRNSKEYVLELENRVNKEDISSIEKSNSEISVQRRDILYYSKNPSQIWRDISIKEIRQDGKITGFRVQKIRTNSKMAQLGLRRGDIIIKANGQPLQSYRDAIKLYENIDRMKVLSLIVKRGNEEKEIIYEIN